MKIKRIAASVASAAIILAGLVWGTGSAMAATTERIAAGQASITIKSGANSGAVNGHTFHVVKLASYTAATNEGTADDPKFTGVVGETNSALVSKMNDVLAGTAYENDIAYHPNNPMGWVAANYADSLVFPYQGELRNFVDQMASTLAAAAGSDYTADSDTYTISGLDDGIYALIDTSTPNNGDTVSIPMIVSTAIHTTRSTAPGTSLYTLEDDGSLTEKNPKLGEVDIKNQSVPTSTKVIGEATNLSQDSKTADVKVGDQITFKLGGTVPNVTNFKSYSYKLKDTASEGLTLHVNTVVVKVEGETLVKGSDYEVVETTDGQNLTIDLTKFTAKLINGAKSSSLIGKDIVVTYQGELNEKAKRNAEGSSASTQTGETNTAYLEYSNNPNDEDGKGRTPDQSTKVYTHDTSFKKVAEDNATALKGAQFKVQIKDGKWLKQDASTLAWSEVDSEDEATAFESAEDGSVKLQGLASGTYTIKETKAPTGYTELALPSFDVNVGWANATGAANGATTPDDTNAVSNAVYSQDFNKLVTPAAQGETKVKNIKNLTQLPLTGGAGMVMMLTVSAILMAVAGAFFIRSRKAAASL